MYIYIYNVGIIFTWYVYYLPIIRTFIHNLHAFVEYQCNTYNGTVGDWFTYTTVYVYFIYAVEGDENFAPHSEYIA